MSFLSSVGSYLGSAFSGEVARTVGLSTACAVGLKVVYEAGDYIGSKAFSLSGGRISLHNVVPERLKDVCRLAGDFFRFKVITPIGMNAPRIGFINDKLPMTDYFPISSTVGACPAIEEGLFRKIPIALVEFISQCPGMTETLAEIGGVSPTTANVLNVATMIFSSACFTYYHENESGTQRLQPGRALGIFLSGVSYYLIAQNFGVLTAGLAHAGYNLSSYM